MANGSFHRGYDLADARTKLSATLSQLDHLEAKDALEARTKQSIQDATRLLESLHATMALQEQNALRLWNHLDGLTILMQQLQEKRTSGG